MRETLRVYVTVEETGNNETTRKRRGAQLIGLRRISPSLSLEVGYCDGLNTFEKERLYETMQ